MILLWLRMSFMSFSLLYRFFTVEISLCDRSIISKCLHYSKPSIIFILFDFRVKFLRFLNICTKLIVPKLKPPIMIKSFYFYEVIFCQSQFMIWWKISAKNFKKKQFKLNLWLFCLFHFLFLFFPWRHLRS